MMFDALTLTKAISNWQHFIPREKNGSDLSSILKQISRLKQELDRSFYELGDMTETVAIYNFYRELEVLQQKINEIEE